jgi:hypothetical protein
MKNNSTKTAPKGSTPGRKRKKKKKKRRKEEGK